MAVVDSTSGEVTPLVGRAEQLAVVVRALAEDVPLCITGESGIGKTTLVEAALAADGRAVRRGGGLATLAWMPFLAVARAVGRTSFDLDEPAAVADAVEAEVGADILFVDDLHACDPGSRTVLELLSARVTVVTAVRLGHEGTAEALESVRRSGFELLELAPLGDDDSRELARRARPGMAGSELARVVQRSGGVPLLLEELAGGTDEATLVRALAARLSALDDDAREAAVLLAVAGRPVDDDLPAFADLVAAHVASAAGPGSVQIRHALLADAVLAMASGDDVRQAHRDLADRTTAPVVRAHHLLAAGDPSRARAAAAEAVSTAATPGARADARLLVVRAAAAEGAQEEADPDELLLAAEDLVTAFRAADAGEVLDRLDAAHVDPDRRARVLSARISAAWSLSDLASVRAAVTEARSLVGTVTPAAGRQLSLRVVRARALAYTDRVGALREAEDLLAEMRRAGEPEAAALLLVGTARYFVDPPAARADLEAALRAAEAEGDHDSELRAANNLVAVLEATGRTDEAILVAQDVAARAEALGLSDWRVQILAMAASTMASSGRHADALDLVDQLIPLAADPRTRLQLLADRADCLIGLDLTGAAAEALDALSRHALTYDIVEGIRAVAIARATFLWQQGRLPEAREEIESSDFSGSDDGYALAAASLLAWVAADSGEVPDVPHGSTAELLFPGGVREIEAVRLSAQGEPARAAERFDVAADLWSARWRYQEMRCRWAAAEERRRAADPHAVTTLLAVEARLLELGYGYLLTRARRSLRLAGVVRSSERALDRGSLLSGREREVLTLAASGLTDPEIALRLGLGRPTVRRTVSNAVAKLGVTTRTAAVAAVAGAGS